MYLMKAFILQGLPPTHTNWKKEKKNQKIFFLINILIALLCFFSRKTHKSIYFDVTKHGRQVVGWGPQAEVVEDVIFQCLQVGVVHTDWAG